MRAGIESQIDTIASQLISTKISKGFAQEVGMDTDAYLDSFRRVMASFPSRLGMSSGQLSIVETRIPFARQLQLLGIDLDPAIFYRVKKDIQQEPYAAWLQVIKANEVSFVDRASYTEALANFPGLRPASPLEAINADFEAILAQSYVVLPGGEYDPRGVLTGGSINFETLCLERYFGRPRISHIPLIPPAKRDGLVGILAARR